MNADGSHSCDRCGTGLPGYGVLYGLVASSIHDGDLRTWLYCYANGCAGHVLFRQVKAEGDDVCHRCGAECLRAPDTAVLTTDLPDQTQPPRMLTFCRAGGCADNVLARGVPSA